MPATSVPLVIFLVVDPDQALDDADRADNVASRTAVLPDLAVANGRWEWIGDVENLASVVARVVNQGSIPAGAAALTLRAGAVDGPVLATVPFGPLAVGQAVDLATTWDLSALPGPTYPLTCRSTRPRLLPNTTS